MVRLARRQQDSLDVFERVLGRIEHFAEARSLRFKRRLFRHAQHVRGDDVRKQVLGVLFEIRVVVQRRHVPKRAIAELVQ